MKFSTREDTDLPAEELFDAISDFPRLERLLLRRGAMIRRLGNGAGPEAWAIGFDWRGKPRQLDLSVATVSPPERLEMNGRSELFDLILNMTVVSLTPSKSRLIFEVDVLPRGMKARLLLQTAKLTKTQLDRKFAERIGDFVLRASAGQFG